jgi:ribosome-associated protein
MTVKDEFDIPADEIEFRASRAGGPGGQHVNRRSSRVEARWNVLTSPSLSDEQRERILRRLATRITREGVLRVVAAAERSQWQNKEIAVERLRRLVADALEVPKPRKKTRPPASARESRLKEKKRRKEIKAARRPPPRED